MVRPERARRPSRGRALLAFALLLVVSATLAGCYVEAPYPGPPPGPPPPAVYVPGQWVWNGAAWVWRPPYWTAAPYGAPPPAAVHPGPPPGQPPQPGPPPQP
jgi:hypothetical protein